MAETMIFNQRGEVQAERDLLVLERQEPNVFETMRTYNRKFFCLEDHLIRLKESAQSIDLPFTWTFSELEKIVKKALKTYEKKQSNRKDDAFVRLMLWPDQLFVMVGVRKHAPEIFKKGISLVTTPTQRPFINASAPQAKTYAYQTGVMAHLEPACEAYEKLFLDAQGYVAEVSIGNIFMVKKQSLLTPSTGGILNGVTRRFVIECALQIGIQTAETHLTRHEIFNADEVFLTNTSWEILPVCELDGRKIGKKSPGPLTQKIHQQFKRKVLQLCRK